MNDLGSIKAPSWFLDMDIPSAVSYTHLRAHETAANLVCRLLLEKKASFKFISLYYNHPNKTTSFGELVVKKTFS